jgi:hypothetical protein
LRGLDLLSGASSLAPSGYCPSGVLTIDDDGRCNCFASSCPRCRNSSGVIPALLDWISVTRSMLSAVRFFPSSSLLLVDVLGVALSTLLLATSSCVPGWLGSFNLSAASLSFSAASFSLLALSPSPSPAESMVSDDGEDADSGDLLPASADFVDSSTSGDKGGEDSEAGDLLLARSPASSAFDATLSKALDAVLARSSSAFLASSVVISTGITILSSSAIGKNLHISFCYARSVLAGFVPAVEVPISLLDGKLLALVVWSPPRRLCCRGLSRGVRI